MATLLLIRHGQASKITGGEKGYDQLSELGELQARRLGAHLARWDQLPQRIFIGPRKRHVQSWDAFREGAGPAAATLPEPVFLDALDEHPGLRIFQSALPRLVKERPEVMRAAAELMRGGEPAPTSAEARRSHRSHRRALFRVFKVALLMWVNGELGMEGEEDWPTFAARTRSALDTMSAGEPDETVAAFSSGGAIGAMVGHVLAMNGAGCMDLGWQIRNSAFAELRFKADDPGAPSPAQRPLAHQLVRFNAFPHLTEPGLVTSV